MRRGVDRATQPCNKQRGDNLTATRHPRPPPNTTRKPLPRNDLRSNPQNANRSGTRSPCPALSRRQTAALQRAMNSNLVPHQAPQKQNNEK